MQYHSTQPDDENIVTVRIETNDWSGSVTWKTPDAADSYAVGTSGNWPNLIKALTRTSLNDKLNKLRAEAVSELMEQLRSEPPPEQSA
jgi:hypothetical protein